MSLLDLLTAGRVEEFNATRGQRARVDLFAADLPEAKLAGVDLSGANVGKADLSGADLSAATLYKADLDGIDGTGLSLRDAVGVRVRLRDAWLEDADLTGADLSNADLADATVIRSKGEDVRLTGARLRETDAREVAWARADLSEARLHKSNFTGADLTGADLSGASGAETVFDSARLDATIGQGLRLSGASLKGASLRQARWQECNLSGADLTDADLQFADLTGSNLSGAVLTGAKLRGAVLANVALDGVDLSGVELDGVDLSGVDPLALGLSEDQIAGLVAVGAQVDADAPLKFLEVYAAVRGGVAALVWENVDGEEEEDDGAPLDEDAPDAPKTPRSLRWAVCRDGTFTHGALPLSADSALATAVAPAADGFTVIALVERPGGVHVLRYPLSADGELGAPIAWPLGYTPAVSPRVAVDADGTLWMWCVARRGPTLVVHRFPPDAGEEPLPPAHSELTATARGFLGRHQPVLACKGDVVMGVARNGAGRPTRMPPEQGKGRLTSAVPVDDRVLAVWSLPPRPREPGGLRFAWLGGRHAPETQILSVGGITGSLDVLPDGDGAWVAWTTSEGLLGATSVHVLRLPDGEIRDVPVDGDVHEVTITVTPPGEEPCLVLTFLDEGVAVVDLDGKVLGRQAGPS